MIRNSTGIVLALGWLGVASTGQAATGVQANIGRPLTLFPQSQSGLVQSSPSGPVELTSTTSFGNGYSYADFGVAKASASLFGSIRVPDAHVNTRNYPYPQDFSSASAFWRDDIVVSGGTGTGVMRVRLFLDGSSSVVFPTSEGSTSVSASVSLTTNNFLGQTWGFTSSKYKYRNPDGTTSQGGATSITTPGPDYYNYDFTEEIPWLGWQEFDVAFTFGAPFELRVDAYCFVGGNTGVFNGVNPVTQLSGASVGGFCDLGQSVYWGGITGVRNSLGGEVGAYSLSSGSGFDYRNASPALPGSGTPAIPEPGSWALMIAGFGLVGAAVRRRGVLSGMLRTR